MNIDNLTILGPHWSELRDLVLGVPGAERAAYLLLGRSQRAQDPWTGGPLQRLVTHDVIAIPSDQMASAGPDHITWSTDSFVALLKRAKEEGLIPAIVHSHVRGPATFSQQDDENEPHLVRLARNRNGPADGMVSLLVTHDGDVRARHWIDDTQNVVVDKVTVLGDQLTANPANRSLCESDPALHRQALAFGEPFNARLNGLTVGVVGAGGTGSAVIMLLARLGIRRLVAFDRDPVETTNLNRLHGATIEDALEGRLKVEVAKREAERNGLGTVVKAVPLWIDDPSCRNALKSCDVIFGCTDDHSGRLFLNRLAFFYGIPVIDVGLAIKVSEDEPPVVQDLSARVSLIQPGEPCMLCRGMVDPRRAAEQDLRRRDPDEFQRRKAEAYVIDGGDPSPAVVTFTTSAAAMAVDELIDLLVRFRRPSPRPSEWRRRFHLMRDSAQLNHAQPTCQICASRMNWGRGDVDPFLDRVG